MSFPCNKSIEFKNKFKKVKDYTFINTLTQLDFTKSENNKSIAFKNMKKSNFLMINQYIEQNKCVKGNPHTYIVIGFKKTIINIEKSFFSKLQPLLSVNPNIHIYLLTKIDDIDINICNNNKSRIIDIQNDERFTEEIDSFNKELLLSESNDKEIKDNWQFIKSCISGYLIKESYEKTRINRLDNFINFEKQKEISSVNYPSDKIPIIKEDEFIELRDVGTGASFNVVLIYHIEREELYAKKKKHVSYSEIDDLIEREIDNYSRVQHPLMPKLIGIGRNKEYLIIEFINGRTLSKIKELQLNFSEIMFFFELFGFKSR